MTKRLFAFISAVVMTMTAMPGFASSAENAEYACGDVDMDGVITGHDTAMVSCYVQGGGYAMSEEQLALADVNEDGAVDQIDADKLYNELQVYHLGDVNCVGDANLGNGRDYYSVTFDDVNEGLKKFAVRGASLPDDSEWTQVQENLADTNLDGKFDISDCVNLLTIIARYGASLPAFDNGKYYF